MYLPEFAKRWLRHKGFMRIGVTEGKPDFIILQNGKPYLERWYVIPRNRFFNIYLHHFKMSDEDFALHDHPWLFNISYVTEGYYKEETFLFDPKVSRQTWFQVRLANSVTFRWGRSPHRVQLPYDYRLEPSGEADSLGRRRTRIARVEKDCWTIFLTGPVVRDWGFFCPKGWVPFKSIIRHRPGEGAEAHSECP